MTSIVRGRICLVVLIGTIWCVGCGPDQSQRDAIEAAIERSDSLRRRPGSPGTRSIPTDIPVAVTSNPDSVVLVPINYADPPVFQGPWVYDLMPGDSGYNGPPRPNYVRIDPRPR
jgi:hypothetical protein